MKALCVFSGGLDSMLAAALIRDQDIDILALFFETPFFGPAKAIESARSMGLPYKVVDIAERHFEVVKHPRHGYGGNMNPCIDCHALMFRIAGEMLPLEEASFVISGEVLGQRPMSQNRQAMRVVEAESGLDGLLLRPLSAKLLPVSIPEAKGWVDRDRLEGFQGRSRKPQMALARRFHITRYPAPGGGCLLTEPVFSKRLRDLLAHTPEPEFHQIELLKLGRHFRLGPAAKIAVGRNKSDNEAIEALQRPGDLLLTAATVPGPSVLLSGKPSEEDCRTAAVITLAYSDTNGMTACPVNVKGAFETVMEDVPVHPKDIYRHMMI
ncbi:Thiamine biosynthesis protein [uncultured Desulfatiglans sp.]|uniref:Thiamine biosynthesis protein n=1 Tax=Uncultured Desulfatiglans sp. TaxID=1748965 RepID=A0A653A4K7_UNCDX|nr:Thiamine biosynthesis protein [uncultured Desulfatiglans sp.]